MQEAWAVLQRQYAGLSCSLSLPLLMSLYDTCVAPVGSYGCELWGSSQMPAGYKPEREKIASLYLKHMGRVAGIRSTVASEIICCELKAMPQQCVWLSRAVTFFNNLVNQPETSLFKKVLLASSIDAVVIKVHNWFWGLKRDLLKYDIDLVAHLTPLSVVDNCSLIANYEAGLRQRFEGVAICPRSCPSVGASYCVYHRYFQRPSWPFADFLQSHVHISLIRDFIRFRTGSHDLPIVRGRLQHIPRPLRVCPKCGPPHVCDELHLVFECAHLAFLRDKYSHLFGCHAPTMKQFIWQTDLVSVMKFISEALRQIVV